MDINMMLLGWRGDGDIDMRESLDSFSDDMTATTSSQSSASPDTTEEADADPITKINKYLPPCEVCGGVSTGLHFGAHTCEACKTFYRRSLTRKQNLVCKKDPPNQCNIVIASTKTKYSCAACRYKKCVDVGMTKEGVKKGRYTYALKTQQTKEYQLKQSVTYQQEHRDVSDLEAKRKHIAAAFSHSFPVVQYLLENKKIVNERIRTEFDKMSLAESEKLTKVLYIPGKYGETEEKFKVETGNKLLQIFQSAREQLESEGDVDLNWKQQQEVMLSDPMRLKAAKSMMKIWGLEYEKVIRQVLNFAKLIPQFSELSIEDRMTLMKGSKMETMMAIKERNFELARGYHVKYFLETDEIILLPVTKMCASMGPGHLDITLRLFARLANFDLTIDDLAVLLVVLILSPDREGLQESDKITRLQEEWVDVLEYTVKKNHPNNKNIFPEILLVLPMFRQHCIQMRDIVETTHKLIQPEMPPLLVELFSDIHINEKQPSQPPQTTRYTRPEPPKNVHDNV